ncbi:SpaH/EbpB family LPXTG-anchored major pilin [Corynebacterium pseudodiphtheriticum]|uniref:SpaH/EbpB family LPXTG-anchored major pilin n=1 Tax=Corynebacterium pseudodiphtheriticum TaxID=37637 RepID=UPI00254ECA4C|nr:SpaH/EbpB family LPXTG-anchored major pilin [Corynebacterium pseudodiphtheriticum]MDK8804591.1 SpaH/EbpB family LPXTG-anchored major pilin [Corynebacterium pseudodiphtheriticum]
MAKAISKPLALAVAVGLTLGGSFGAGAPAFAQNAVDAPQTAEQVPPASTIPAGNNFSLTIHKRVNSQTLRQGTGQQDDQVGGQPLQGVDFKIQKLAGDIREQSDFSRLAALAKEYNQPHASADAPALDDSFTEQTRTTTAAGEANFSNLPAGAYLVTETKTPDPEGAQTFVASKPFIAFVPMTNPQGNGWNSDVHVYPKNSEVRVTKQVDDANKHASNQTDGRNVDSKVTYTLDGLVPAAPAGRVLRDFKLTDASKSDELSFGENFVTSVVRIPAGGTPDQAVPLTPNQHYTVKSNASLPNNTTNMANGADQAFDIVISDPAAAGLQPGDTVRAVVEATMLQAPDQQIENSVNESGVFRDPSTGADDQPFETPNDKVVTYIGKIRVLKIEERADDAEGEPKPLAGAKFDLYNCETPDNVLQSGTTNNQGTLTFEGIHVSDWVDNESPETNVEYCLKETQAPAGYTTLTEETRVTLLRESQGTIGEGPEARQVRLVSATIQNRPTSEVPILPSTGGMGILLVALLGLGIIAGGVYAARRNSAKA